jgi:hypothetical protein
MRSEWGENEGTDKYEYTNKSDQDHLKENQCENISASLKKGSKNASYKKHKIEPEVWEGRQRETEKGSEHTQKYSTNTHNVKSSAIERPRVIQKFSHTRGSWWIIWMKKGSI